MQAGEQQDNRSISSSSCPPALQLLVFPESASAPPKVSGMSGSYLSGERGTLSKGGAPGKPQPRVPPRRSTSFLSQGFKILPESGTFELYEGMEPQPHGSPLSSDTSPGPGPNFPGLGAHRASPRILPVRTNRRLSGGAATKKPPTKVLKGIDKVNPKSSKLPSAKPVLPDIASQYDRMLMGHLDKLPERSSSTIRIFLSSTFSDFKVERNYLVKHAYPKLQQYCEERGFEFQVLDLRWGITDSAVNDHTVEALCLAEIENCKHISPGPNFVSMLGNRYGYRPLPRIIPASEFDTLVAIASDAGLPDQGLLSSWYIKDYNALPTSYVLQDIQKTIPHYGDYTLGNEAKRKEANAQWWAIMTKLQALLRKAAMVAHGRQQIDDSRLHTYHMSVTEQEVIQGLLSCPYAETSCISIVRDIEDIDVQGSAANKYVDTVKDGDADAVDIGAEALMTSLKTSLTNKLPGDSIQTFSVKWKDGGLDKDDPNHCKYLKTFSKGLVEALQGLISEQITQERERRKKVVSHTVTIQRPTTPALNKPVQTKPKRGKRKLSEGDQKDIPFGGGIGNASEAGILRGFMTLNTLINDHQAAEKGVELTTFESQVKLDIYSEIHHHLSFCQNKCDTFMGRLEELEMIRNYMTSPEEAPPMVVTSVPGGGKTSFMAKIAEMSKQWLGDQTVTIVRFLGTSPASSTLLGLLGHLCVHICLAYGEMVYHHAMDHIGKSQKMLRDLLVLVSLSHGMRRPLVIVLDSIDQLSQLNRPYLLHWLPKYLPPSVKIIISMTPDVNNCVEHARAHLQSDDNFMSLHLQPLPPDIATRFIEEYPRTQLRNLTESQIQQLVLGAETLPPPLLLKLWLDEACLWTSYQSADSQILAETVNEAVETIFLKLENKYGAEFVASSLGYISICYDGISEVELEDVLSCDDVVLNEVFKYHDPPLEGTIRIPALIWARLRFDLKEYLMENQTMKRRILSWYHRQFGEVATSKYASGSAGKRLHLCLAEVFMVEKKLCRTIELTQRNKRIANADRLVRPQALEPSNTRKLICVPYHLKMSDGDRLKQEVICNLRFLECIYQGIINHASRNHEKALIWQLLEDVDEETHHVVKALRMARPYASRDIKLLPVQLLDMLLPYSNDHAQINKLCEQAEEALEASSGVQLKPVMGWVGDEVSPVNWYVEGPTRIIHQSPDGSTLLLGYSGKGRSVPLCRVFDVQSCQVTHSLMKTNKLANDILYSGLLSQNNRRAYLLCKKNYVIYSLPESGNSRAVVNTNNVNSAGALNETITVSSNDKVLVLAGPSRIAMFEDKGKAFDEPDFRVVRAMNFSGATATTNIIFKSDETGTISTHTVPGQKRVIGAIACWTFYSNDPSDKVPLPEPVPPGCLKALPSMIEPECVLAGCADGKVYIVSLGLGAILKEIKNSVGLRGYNLLMNVHANYKYVALGSKDMQAIALLDLGEEAMVGHAEAKHTVQALQMGPDENHVCVLTRDGILKLYSIEGLEEKASCNIHDSDTTSLFCPDSRHILTSGYDKTLKQLELAKLFSKAQYCEALKEEEMLNRLEYASMDVFMPLGDDAIITGNHTDPPMVWDLKTNRKIKQLEGSENGSVNICLGLQESHIITMDRTSKSATLWKWPEGKQAKLPPYVKDIINMKVSPKDDEVVFLCEHAPGTLVIVYNLAENKEKLRLIVSEKISPSSPMFITKNGRYVTFLRDILESDGDGGMRKVVGALSIDTTENSEQDTSWVEHDINIIVPLDSELFLLGEKNGVVVWQPPKVIGISDMTKLYQGWLQLKYTTSKEKKDSEDVTVELIAVSNDDRLIAAVADDGAFVLWNNVIKDPSASKLGLHLRKHKNPITCLAFSPDSQYLASGSADKTLVLWDTKCGAAISQIHSHARITDVQFTKDGLYILFLRKTSQVQRLSMWSIPQSG